MTKKKGKKTFKRRNPGGQEELVVKKKGEQDKETLNELVESVLDMLEGIINTGPLPTGGGAGSPEQLQYQRNRNQPDAHLMVGSSGDQERAAGESPNNMTGSTPRAADGPEKSRAKSKHKATARGTPPRDKYIAGYYGDNIDYGATHSESFTGTGDIAIAPTSFPVQGEEPDEPDESDQEEDEDTIVQSESIMSRPRVIREWAPAFKSGNYDPGDHQMPKAAGGGVTNRKPKQSKVGQYDTNVKNQGKAWPRKHNETAAMCDVDDDGTENKPQGVHVSRVGKPEDNHQTQVGHDWPDGPTNSGSAVAEPMKGNRWSDGGELTGGRGSEEFTYKKGGPGLPSGGPTKGQALAGPQMGHMSSLPNEGWSPESIGQLIDEEHNLQSLFDAYARDCEMVCLEDFQVLCHAHGIDTRLTEDAMVKLIKDNDEFIFYEGRDADGPYWTPTPFAKNIQEGKNGGAINELEVRSPEEETRLGQADTPGGYKSPDMVGDPEEDPDYEMDPGDPPGPRGYHNASYEPCPECGEATADFECPYCGIPVRQEYGETELPSERQLHASPEDIDQDDEDWERYGEEATDEDFWGTQDFEDTEEKVFDPAVQEAFDNFLESAENIIEQNMNGDRRAIGDALTRSWHYYTSSFNPRRAPSFIQTSLQEMKRRFPRFNPLSESDAMQKPEGTVIGGKGAGGPSDKNMLSPQDQPGPDGMKDEGEPLGKKQKNTRDKTPTIKGTEKGMTGSAVKENVRKITRHTQKQLQEGASRLRGKFGVNFHCLVREGNEINATPRRKRLAEAVADAEELLQFHPSNAVVMEANFVSKGENVLTHRIPMLQVKRRRPIVAEGASLFRFNRHAELYAEQLMNEGRSCRLSEHNWGIAVKST